MVLCLEGAMFFRLKKSGPRSYLQIVENRRDGRAVRQSVIATIGRIDELAARGGLATLLASGARFCEQVMLLSALDDPEQSARLSCQRIGGPLLFGRLWERLGIGAVLEELLAPRAFEFALERAVFVATLHRLFVSGSDRDCASWMQDYAIPGAESLSLHHFYRAMAWLGEELPEERQDHATPFSPRTIKDEIEEALFARHRDLFTDLSVVFMDTTSLSFEGEGGETLGAHGYSKDHRPDLKQMILAVVVDGEGRPICTEMMPGNTADVSVLVPVIDRLRHRFGIMRACVVADRGMISEATIAALEERGLEYVLGVRERTDARVRTVLDDARPFTPLLIERARGETQLFVKEVQVEGIRYIAARNEAEAEKDAADRASDRRRPRSATEAGRQGADRQLRLPALSAHDSRRRPSRLTLARSPKRRATTASLSCAPMPGSRRFRRCCAIASFSPSRPCSAPPRPVSTRARSSIPRTPPSAATCSAPSSPFFSRRSSSRAARRRGQRNGRTSCATLTGSRRQRWRAGARPGRCAPKLQAQSQR